MFIKCCRLSIIVFAFLLFAIHVTFAQSPLEKTRPRTLSNANKKVVSEPENPDTSPEDKAEALRLYKAGAEYAQAGLHSQSAQLFERAIELRPDYEDAYRGLGQAYFELGQWQKAVDSLERLISLNPKDKDALKLLEQARQMLQTAETQEPDTQQKETTESLKDTPPTSTGPTSYAGNDEHSLTKIYRVGPADVLEVRRDSDETVQPELITVSDSGRVELARLAEPLQVAGLTVEEIGERLKLAFNSIAESNDHVSVGINEYVSHKILVSGLVKEPGTKILQREAIPLSVVIADAQPLPEAGRATIVRNESNEVLTVDLNEPSSAVFLVRAGDVITLQATPAKFFYVAGNVKDPGEKVFHSGLTLTQAIITAGGLSKKSKEAQLGRDDDKGFLNVTKLKLKDIEAGKIADPMIQPGDRIVIKD